VSEGYIDIPLGDMRSNLTDTVVMTVGGTGLEPELLVGDRVLVDLRLTKPKKGDVVVVKVLGGYLAGRWSKKRGRKFLLATHPLTRPVDLSLHDAWEIVGTVTKVVGRDLGRAAIGVSMTVTR
jgi:SOS-response transcriptional repressor LexA